MVVTPPLAQVCWQPSWRLVASRLPPTGRFEQVADPADLEAVYLIESLTNERWRDALGELSLVPVAERVSGPETTPIMAAFTHLDPLGSRFTDGSYGVYYAARYLHTAILETAFHEARFLAATREPPIEMDMRTYASDIDVECHDPRRSTMVQRKSWRASYAWDGQAISTIYKKRLYEPSRR